MALKATIFKAQINIADMDRHYYQDHSLTIARHPSENDERMMQRVLCFCLYAHEQLDFTKGLSTDDEPDLWQVALSGEIEHWIDLGQPDEKRIRKACGRASQVTIFCYSGNGAKLWFEKIESRLGRFNNLRIVNIDNDKSIELVNLVNRNMQIQVTIEDQQIYIGDGQHNIIVVPDVWYE